MQQQAPSMFPGSFEREHFGRQSMGLHQAENQASFDQSHRGSVVSFPGNAPQHF
jgi:hypothetical protein